MLKLVSFGMLLALGATFPAEPDEHQAGLNMRAEINNFSQKDIGTLVPSDIRPTNATPKYNCTLSHRSHENDTNKFEVFHQGEWRTQVCQNNLVWNQTLCRCDYLYATKTLPECKEFKPHLTESGHYQQLVNGKWVVRDCNHAVSGLVWNQTLCRCEWAPNGESHLMGPPKNVPCDAMFNVTFEEGLFDHAKNSFIELNNNAKIFMRRNTGSGSETAAFLDDAVMTVWYFAGNELSDSVRVEFKFKADKGINMDKYQIILSNGCNVTDVGYTTPSLAIGYRPKDQSYLLALETVNVKKAIVCTRETEKKRPFEWHKVSLIYEDGTLLMRVDNQPCIISEDFTGSVQKTSCPLTIGSDPLDRESRFRGYLDDISVSRYCHQFVENVPVDSPQPSMDNLDNRIQPYMDMAALV